MATRPSKEMRVNAFRRIMTRGCKELMFYTFLEDHEGDCPQRQELCSCGKLVAASEYQTHCDTCEGNME